MFIVCAAVWCTHSLLASCMLKNHRRGWNKPGMLDLYVPTERGLSTRLAHACTEAHWQRPLGQHRGVVTYLSCRAISYLNQEF